MKSPNAQHLIAQEIFNIDRGFVPRVEDIIYYDFNGDYRIAVSAKQGMFSGSYIRAIEKLRQKYGFSWFISDTCAAVTNGNLFIIIY